MLKRAVKVVPGVQAKLKPSKVGLKPIEYDASKTKVDIKGHWVRVTGPKGHLIKEFHDSVIIKNETQNGQEKGLITVNMRFMDDMSKSWQGTTRSIINNMIEGVNSGFVKVLELVGVGYRVSKVKTADGKDLLELHLGYSDVKKKIVPEGMQVLLPNQTTLIISGVDKQKIGEFACRIRLLRPPETYKGKGIRHLGEKVKLKVVNKK